MKDESGMDEKLIVYPISKVDSKFDKIKNITDVPNPILKKIEHFFNRYKDLSKGKFVKSNGFRNKQYALKVLKKSQELFKKKLHTVANKSKK